MLRWIFLIFLGLGTGLAPMVRAGDETLETRLIKAFDAGELNGLHSVVLLSRGEIDTEVYFEGYDQRWGASLGIQQHGPDTLHDLRSATKSIVGLLYGIALSEGIVPGPEAPLLEQFPEYADLKGDPQRDAIRVGDVLNMTMGTEWDETLPYTDPRNSEIAMERAKDRYRFVLDRPMKGDPGQGWTYNGGATALAAQLIERGSGMRLEDYAQERLFSPLGITKVDWVTGADGRASAASGLRLTARDMARIGQLILDGGRAGDRQIVPAAWLDAAFTPQADTPWGNRYSHFWWLAPEGNPVDWIAASGNGGQRMVINVKHGVVLLVFAGNYDRGAYWQLPLRVLTEFAIPALSGR